jgi:hypothetical protein
MDIVPNAFNPRFCLGLDKYWETINGLLWPRLNQILHLNIQSVRDCDPARDIIPPRHYYPNDLGCGIRTCLRRNFVQNIFLFCRLKFSAYFHLLKSWRLIVESGSGSVTFLYGSGFADPYHWFTDPYLDPALFSNGFPDANKKYVFSRFFCLIKIRPQVVKTSQNFKN